MWALQGGHPLTELSVQQIVSCDRNIDEGCNGGDTPTAYKYVEKAGGLETETVSAMRICLSHGRDSAVAHISTAPKLKFSFFLPPPPSLLSYYQNYPYKSGNGRTGKCEVKKSKEVATFDGFHYVSRLGAQEKVSRRATG